jgi:hypothetical protein
MPRLAPHVQTGCIPRGPRGARGAHSQIQAEPLRAISRDIASAVVGRRTVIEWQGLLDAQLQGSVRIASDFDTERCVAGRFLS